MTSPEIDTSLHRTLGRVEGKLDTLMISLASKNSEQDARLNTHGVRLSAVEKRQSWFIGYGAAAGAAVAAAWGWFSKGGTG